MRAVVCPAGDTKVKTPLLSREWSSKVVYVLEFKCTSPMTHYRERGEARARAQHEVLVKNLEKVAGEAVGENSGWKTKLVVFVGSTCGSVHVQTLNNNLKELGVIESKRNTIRRGLVHELLNAQERDDVVYWYLTRFYAHTLRKDRASWVRD